MTEIINVSAVAILFNSSGKVLGQMLFTETNDDIVRNPSRIMEVNLQQKWLNCVIPEFITLNESAVDCSKDKVLVRSSSVETIKIRVLQFRGFDYISL